MHFPAHGSSTKMFIAVATAQLVESAKVGLDEAIGRYGDGLTPEASTVTIRQLLSHTGYLLLGMLIGRASGQSYTSYSALTSSSRPT
jgi:CubicO group peptidase (beta-lactamase class C family)